MSTPEKSPKSALEVGIAFAAGVLFAVGLAISGMTQPSKVVGFLDVAGAWDPSLAFVMVGAIGVYLVATRLIKQRSAPLSGGCFDLPTRRDIDPKLVVGAAIFGVGWGLGGYCPGPGLTAAGACSLPAFTFVVAMALGMLLYEGVQKRKWARAHHANAEQTSAEQPDPA